MFSSKKKLHFITHLCNWAQAILHKVKSRCKRSSRGRRLKGFPNSFDHFAAMEISNQLRQVFKLIDANRDGKISSLELRELLLCLGYEKSTAAKEAEGMVKELDCNGDGYIDMEEFMEAMRSRGEEDGLMDAFLMFDTDGDGFISAKELQRVLISLGYAKCSLDECLRMIRGVDKNGDGLVDFEEFGSMMTGHQI